MIDAIGISGGKLTDNLNDNSEKLISAEEVLKLLN